MYFTEEEIKNMDIEDHDFVFDDAANETIVAICGAGIDEIGDRAFGIDPKTAEYLDVYYYDAYAHLKRLPNGDIYCSTIDIGLKTAADDEERWVSYEYISFEEGLHIYKHFCELTQIFRRFVVLKPTNDEMLSDSDF